MIENRSDASESWLGSEAENDGRCQVPKSRVRLMMRMMAQNRGGKMMAENQSKKLMTHSKREWWELIEDGFWNILIKLFGGSIDDVWLARKMARVGAEIFDVFASIL